VAKHRHDAQAGQAMPGREVVPRRVAGNQPAIQTHRTSEHLKAEHVTRGMPAERVQGVHGAHRQAAVRGGGGAGS